MFARGCLFLVPVCASGGLSCLFVGVGVVGVFGALKSPFNLGARFALQDVTDRGMMMSCTKY